MVVTVAAEIGLMVRSSPRAAERVVASRLLVTSIVVSTVVPVVVAAVVSIVITLVITIVVARSNGIVKPFVVLQIDRRSRIEVFWCAITGIGRC